MAGFSRITNSQIMTICSLLYNVNMMALLQLVQGNTYNKRRDFKGVFVSEDN